MIRQLPVIPTLLVLAAAAIMVRLGFWQLDRADEKAALIADFEAKAAQSEVIEIQSGNPDAVYRSVRLDCPNPSEWQAIAGRSREGRSGFAHRYKCATYTKWNKPDPDQTEEWITYADIGWSQSPDQPAFVGGMITGTLVALGDDYKVVAAEPLAGLQPLAKPDPKDLPNNHLAYAGQWFLFALTALLIYGFALRARLAKRD